jgi:hypothetical protein
MLPTLTRSALGPILATLCLSLLVTSTAHADWLITTDGERIETTDAWRIKGKTVVFKNSEGKLSSLRLADINLEASEAATEKAHANTAKPTTSVKAPGAEKSSKKRSTLVITDADIRPSSIPSGSGAEYLQERLRTALERKDVAAAMNLVRWEGAPQRARTLMQSLLDDAIKKTLTDISIVAVGEDDVTEYEIDGVTYRPNVEVTGKMLVSLEAPEGSETKSSRQLSFLIGRALGNYYIASAIAVDDSDE